MIEPTAEQPPEPPIPNAAAPVLNNSQKLDNALGIAIQISRMIASSVVKIYRDIMGMIVK